MDIRIGTRGSKLALTQSEWVKKKLERRHSGIRVDLVKIKTTGDKILDVPLSKVGGKGLFVKEIEEALLENRVDVAVHSMKDVPAQLPDDLMLSTFPPREDPSDALISGDQQSLDQLPKGAKVGTSSLRRGAQLLHFRPDLKLVPLRGNVDTRLNKLKSENLQAIILATAGLNRLGLSNVITQTIPFHQLLPAVGQGALGLEVRRGDQGTIDLLDFLNHEETQTAVTAERAFLKTLEGGCQVPIAGFARVNGDTLSFEGLVAELDGSKIYKETVTGRRDEAENIGIEAAQTLLASGGGDVLRRLYEESDG
ncbi:MAG: hydroxymethylbilane synthase [Deltaproteobacteria bacterium]|jgi:hydroxymethylbilane synthase|nr:hydroxymethylbilane synthase [Deltaproteobacteria bacterium]